MTGRLAVRLICAVVVDADSCGFWSLCAIGHYMPVWVKRAYECFLHIEKGCIETVDGFIFAGVVAFDVVFDTVAVLCTCVACSVEADDEQCDENKDGQSDKQALD